MKTLWSKLRGPSAAAGFLLCLAACDKPAARPPRDTPPPHPAPASAFSEAAGRRDTVFPAIASPASSPASVAPASKPGLADLATLAETDPRAALLAAGNADLGGAASYLRGNFLRQWAMRDFTAALAYADSQPPGPARDEMFGRLALVLAEFLPHEAAAIVAEDIAPGECREEAAISVLHRWAPRDPAAAAAWAATFPPGALRERALAEVANTSLAPDRRSDRRTHR